MTEPRRRGGVRYRCGAVGEADRHHLRAAAHPRTEPPRHLRRIFVWVERLATWSMVEVFVLGVFVAYVKLGDLVKIELNAGVYALLALTVVIVWADGALDREAIWDAFDSGRAREYVTHGRLQRGRLPPGAVGCETCTLVVVPDENRQRCPRCGSPLHARKPDSLARTWALVVAAAVAYVPANLYPVLTVMQLGAGQPSTILGGVRELDPIGDVSAGRVGVLCQYRRADAEDGRPYRDVGLCADWPHKVASRPNAALLHHPLDRSLVDDRHLHGGSAWRSCAIWRSCHHRARHRRGGVLRVCHTHDFCG